MVTGLKDSVYKELLTKEEAETYIKEKPTTENLNGTRLKSEETVS